MTALECPAAVNVRLVELAHAAMARDRRIDIINAPALHDNAATPIHMAMQRQSLGCILPLLSSPLVDLRVRCVGGGVFHDGRSNAANRRKGVPPISKELWPYVYTFSLLFSYAEHLLHPNAHTDTHFLRSKFIKNILDTKPLRFALDRLIEDEQREGGAQLDELDDVQPVPSSSAAAAAAGAAGSSGSIAAAAAAAPSTPSRLPHKDLVHEVIRRVEAAHARRVAAGAPSAMQRVHAALAQWERWEAAFYVQRAVREANAIRRASSAASAADGSVASSAVSAGSKRRATSGAAAEQDDEDEEGPRSSKKSKPNPVVARTTARQEAMAAAAAARAAAAAAGTTAAAACSAVGTTAAAICSPAAPRSSATPSSASRRRSVRPPLLPPIGAAHGPSVCEQRADEQPPPYSFAPHLTSTPSVDAVAAAAPAFSSTVTADCIIAPTSHAHPNSAQFAAAAANGAAFTTAASSASAAVAPLLQPISSPFSFFSPSPSPSPVPPSSAGGFSFDECRVRIEQAEQLTAMSAGLLRAYSRASPPPDADHRRALSHLRVCDSALHDTARLFERVGTAARSLLDESAVRALAPAFTSASLGRAHCRMQLSFFLEHLEAALLALTLARGQLRVACDARPALVMEAAAAPGQDVSAAAVPPAAMEDHRMQTEMTGVDADANVAVAAAAPVAEWATSQQPLCSIPSGGRE